MLLLGCAGTDTSVAIPSPYAGSYTGTWNAPSIPSNGTMTLAIADNGNITGTIGDATTSGTVTGGITNAGNVTGTIKFTGQPDSSLTGPLTLSGRNLSGTLVETLGGVSTNLVIDLTK